MRTPPRRPWILAHRGLHSRRRENSLPALDAARRAGVDGVEFDVRALADGTGVLHHDATLRAGRRRRRLSRLRLDVLRRLPAGRSVPTVQDVVAWARHHPRLQLDVELKEDAALAPALSALRGLDAHRWALSSFSLPLLHEAQQRVPHVKVGWIRRRLKPRRMARAVRAGVPLLVLHEAACTPTNARAARDAGLEVWAWDVNRSGRARALRDLGITAFITDAPRRLLAAFEAPAPR